MSFIESLLYEDESQTLDVKREQYRFEHATHDDKSELLKDILAFANAWRRTDAYILIGVEEVRGGKDRVLGVKTHLDDAKLQQFVNSKTQRPMQFSYSVQMCEGTEIGVIHILRQERPFYLKKSYGRLKKDLVYVRRGSSTAEASPDEIARMGQYVLAEKLETPSLGIQFFDSHKGIILGDHVVLETVLLGVPQLDDVPDYSRRLSGAHPRVDILDPSANEHYYRELAEYLRLTYSVRRMSFAVENSGSGVANNVRLEIEVFDENGSYALYDAESYPRRPSQERIGAMIRPFPEQLELRQRDLTVTKLSCSWRVEANLGKIQPKRTMSNVSPFYVGAKDGCSFEFETVLYADNVPEPVRRPLTVTIQTKTRELDADMLLNPDFDT